ncbi:MAG: HAMP domain-containing histidine kinase [Flavobacteriales bacterium]|nr:HAMP domain-containing histidine kinase [Flavobacteriales bacterium]
MTITDKKNFIRWTIVLFSSILIVFIVYQIFHFFTASKQDERFKMEVWAKALEKLNNADENTDVELLFLIIRNNTTIPIVHTDKNDLIIDVINVDEKQLITPEKSKDILKELKKENPPIRLNIGRNDYQLLYYGNSPLLTKLKYYPLILFTIVFLFGLLVFNFYAANKIAAENNLWVGMAKETAHQIGTPLSSLIGWVEIMRAENVDELYITEIQNDINRLQVITDRFSRIGSVPVLEIKDLVNETKKTVDYMAKRASSKVSFKTNLPEHPIYVSLNPSLHSWTIENLVKNAIDAMKGKGKLYIEIIEEQKLVHIRVKDTGSGIVKSKFKEIFQPGITSKKRGWGLGLSLTKRIVEEYHLGKIKVLHSEIGKGTTMQITYTKSQPTKIV